MKDEKLSNVIENLSVVDTTAFIIVSVVADITKNQILRHIGLLVIMICLIVEIAIFFKKSKVLTRQEKRTIIVYIIINILALIVYA